DNVYKDFQARVSGTVIDPGTGLPSPQLTLVNAGKMKIRGTELEAAFPPGRAALPDAQKGVLGAQYAEVDDVRFPGGSRAFQTPAFSPEWTARFGGQYTFDLADAGGLTVGAQARYRSEQALAVDNTVVGSKARIGGLFQDAYWLTDARVVWQSA